MMLMMACSSRRLAGPPSRPRRVGLTARGHCGAARPNSLSIYTPIPLLLLLLLLPSSPPSDGDEGVRREVPSCFGVLTLVEG